MSMTDDSRNDESERERDSKGPFERQTTLPYGDRDPGERPGRQSGSAYAYGSVEARLLRGARLAHARVAVGIHSFTTGKLVSRV